jgi:hypothetical protein
LASIRTRGGAGGFQDNPAFTPKHLESIIFMVAQG